MMTKKLSELLKVFAHKIVFNEFSADLADSTEPDSIEITGFAFDSKSVEEGFLFFALPGTHTTGNIFIPDAIKKGARAVVFQDKEKIDSTLLEKIKNSVSEKGKPVIFMEVAESRIVMAPVSAEFYDYPSKKMAIVGVTGTEGKSSTVSFIWQLLRLSGHKAGFISTVQYSDGGEAADNPEHQTTPEAPIIQKKLFEMVQNGCEYAVIETSSHGLSSKLNRTGNILFDAGIFMNVTLEHLEFHKTFEKYRDDKANLFRKLDEHTHEKIINGKKRKIPSFGIVNLEDASAEFFIKATKSPVIGFTTEGKAGKSAGEGTKAESLPPIPENIPVLTGKNIAAARYGITFDLIGKDESDKNGKPTAPMHIHVKAPLPGAFNAYNIIAAIGAVSRLTETPLEKIAPLTEKLVSVKGRMTVIDKGQPFELIVDYAHTPSSFETIFPPLRRRCSGRIIALFGSGGERDLKKRPLQGEIAARFCDLIFLTDEDPRGEDSVELLKMIAAGIEKQGKKEGSGYFIIPSRPKAIREAFKTAKKDDIVLLLGKSHENTIIYKDFAMPYDEITEAENALSELGYK